MKRENKPIKISNVLENFFKNHRYLYYRIKMESAVTLWEKINDPIVKMYTRAISAKDGILKVKTNSPIVAGELLLKEKELIYEINSLIGAKLIKRILFRSGYVKSGGGNRDNDLKIERKVSSGVLKKIDNLVITIKDEELKEDLKMLFIESYKSKH